MERGILNSLATVIQEKHLIRRETNGRNKLSFKAVKLKLYNNLETVLQEKDLMRRETNGRKK